MTTPDIIIYVLNYLVDIRIINRLIDNQSDLINGYYRNNQEFTF